MPLLIELPEAGLKLRTKFSNQGFAEQTFSKPASLGNFNSNGFAINDQFPSTLDGDPVVRTYNNFTINEGHTVTPINRCKGMYLFIEGNLIVNGILSMTARGANAPGKFIGIDLNREFIYFNETDIFSQYKMPVIGKIGGASLTAPHLVGNPGINGACGGGGDGHVEWSFGARGGFGGNGTSFSGGAGGGSSPRGTAGSGGVNGGAGGNGVAWFTSKTYPAAGGAGNPGGAGSAGAGAGQSGTGGLMLLFVKGDIIFGTNGQIISSGSKGGNGYLSGGGSGGGAIHLFHKGDISNPEKITAPGGLPGDRFAAHGSPGAWGYKGGDGSISLNRI